MTARTIGGALDTAALARLHFTVLSQAEQRKAIERQAARGMSAYDIAAATGWSAEAVQAVLRQEAAA